MAAIADPAEDVVVFSNKYGLVPEPTNDNYGVKRLGENEYIIGPNVCEEEDAKQSAEKEDDTCDNTCVICMDHEKDAVLLNCGHNCSCLNCANTLSICPICRANIEKVIKIYKS